MRQLPATAMLLVIANPTDVRGPLLCEQLAGAGARLLVPADLHIPGWSHEPAQPQRGTAMIDGEAVGIGAIDGVCTLMPCVFATDLPLIASEEREYVAAEMTAFLCAWLATLPCRVINPPNPACLCGPHWDTARWLHLAAQVGLPVLPTGSAGCDDPTPTTVNVVGGTVLGASGQAAEFARQLAAAAGLALLRVHLAGEPASPTVAGADVWIDPAQPGVAAAIHDTLGERP